MKDQNTFFRLGKLLAVKLLYAFLTVLACAILLIGLMLIGRLFDSSDIYLVLFLVWIPPAFGIRYFFSHRFGYLVHGAYVAVATEALVTGRIPPSLFEHGTATVRRHFVSPAQYDAYRRMLQNAFSQLRHVASLRDAKRDDHHGTLTECINAIFASYLRDCCIGYTFYRRDTNSYLAASDAIAIAYRNRRHLHRDAGTYAFLAAFSMVLLTAVLFPLLLLIIRLFGMDIYLAVSYALIFSVLLALSVKYAFVDSYLFLQIMRLYLGAAQVTVIDDAMYAKLCAISDGYADLYEKGLSIASRRPRTEIRRPTADYRDMQYTGEFAQMTLTQELRLRESYCSVCGAKNAPGSKVCASCGTPMGAQRTPNESTEPKQ